MNERNYFLPQTIGKHVNNDETDIGIKRGIDSIALVQIQHSIHEGFVNPLLYGLGGQVHNGVDDKIIEKHLRKVGLQQCGRWMLPIQLGTNIHAGLYCQNTLAVPPTRTKMGDMMVS